MVGDGFVVCSCHCSDVIRGALYLAPSSEFHGERATSDPSLCPSGDLSKCWYANILAARSEDGGRTFVMPALPERALAVSPFKYIPDGGRQGITEFTNIVEGARRRGALTRGGLEGLLCGS